MKSCFVVLLVVVCVAVAEGQNCFKDGELKKQGDACFEKSHAAVITKCKTEQPETGSDECKLRGCVGKKFKDAMGACEGEMHDKMKCAVKKLEVKFEFSCSEFKTKTLDITLPDKKKTVEDIMAGCKDIKDFIPLTMKLKEACPDMKANCEKEMKCFKGE